jgi:transcriptional regulator
VYVPKAFDASDRTWCHALIEAESFGILVSVDDGGLPFATHLPFLLERDRGPHGTLLGHVARANPHWRQFAGPKSLAIFAGPHAYVSPSWYAVHPSVPTWNYVAVHAYGTPVVIEDPGRIRALLSRLVATHEAGLPAPWSVDALPEDYRAGMERGIVAFEMPIERLEGKAKLSQNRGSDDRARVRAALAASDDRLATAVAALMENRLTTGG